MKQSFRDGAIHIVCSGGIARITVDIPKERNDNLTLHAAQHFVNTLALLQTLQFDPIIDEAIVKAGFRQKCENLAKNIVNAKKILFQKNINDNSGSASPDEDERIQSDQAFGVPAGEGGGEGEIDDDEDIDE